MFKGPYLDKPPMPDRFFDRLYISDARTAASKEARSRPDRHLPIMAPAHLLQVLKDHGITHVLSAVGIPPPHLSDFQYLVLEIDDSEYEDLLVHFPKCHDFIDGALLTGGSVLIHWCVDERLCCILS